MKALTALRRLTKQKAPGPPSTFTELHMAKAVEIIGESATGRVKLSRQIGLGEGATRTLINRLVDAQLASSTKQGIRLTRDGLSILRELQRNFPRGAIVSESSITVGAHNFGILVRNAGHKVTSGIKQRDAAVRAGATGAVTLVYNRGRLIMPSIESISRRPDLVKQILNMFRPEENDAIVIAGAETKEKAEESARAAAWTLLQQI